MTFDKDAFVKAAREAVGSPQPTKAVRALLEETIAQTDPQAIIDSIPLGDEEEIMLFEDEHASIWFCRFDPSVVLPPHEHKMNVHIGVLRGGEKNILYRREAGTLKHIKTKTVNPGEVLSLGSDGIHAVTADGDEPSYALHVYEGPLMQIKRSLFDWESGEEIEFTMENFYAMQKPSAEFSVG